MVQRVYGYDNGRRYVRGIITERPPPTRVSYRPHRVGRGTWRIETHTMPPRQSILADRTRQYGQVQMHQNLNAYIKSKN